jgi:hypothetical protein
LCSTLVFGGNTHYLELYWMLETLCLDRSWWFSPCHVLLLGPSFQGPTWISLLWLYIGYICVPHWGWVLAPITWNFTGLKFTGASSTKFHSTNWTEIHIIAFMRISFN